MNFLCILLFVPLTIPPQARRDAADQLWAAHREGLARFEAGCSYSQQVAPDPEQLMRALGQAVPATELADPAAKPNLVPLDKLLQVAALVIVPPRTSGEYLLGATGWLLRGNRGRRLKPSI